MRERASAAAREAPSSALGFASSSHILRTRTTVRPPNESFERDAEQVAAMVHSGIRGSHDLGELTSRLRRRVQPGAPGSAGTIAPGVEGVVDRLRGGGSPLAAGVRRDFEARLGHDFGDVRIHADDRAGGVAEALAAEAFTVGSDVVFARGRYAPASSDGRRLLAHELAHVVQQSADGPLAPAVQRQASDAKPAAAAGPARPSVGPVRRVKVWVNAFIPHTTIEGPPGSECFAGDARGFSNAVHASSRAHQEIEFEVGTLRQTIDWRHVGTTHEVDCATGAGVGTGTAPTSELTNGPVTALGSLVEVRFRTAARNPLVAAAPAIDLDGKFAVDPASRTCVFVGKHDGFPAYEAYVAADGGAGVFVYGYDPRSVGEGPTALFPPMEKTAFGRPVRF